MPRRSSAKFPYKMKIHVMVQMVLEVFLYVWCPSVAKYPLEAGSSVVTLLMQRVPSVTDAPVVINWHI